MIYYTEKERSSILIKGLRRALYFGERAFTLIELLIVLVILGALAAVVVPNVSKFISTANFAASNNEMMSVKTAAMSYAADNGCFPNNSYNLMTEATAGTPYNGPEDYMTNKTSAVYAFGNKTQVNNNTHTGGGAGVYPNTIGSINVITIYDVSGQSGISRNLTWDYDNQVWKK